MAKETLAARRARARKVFDRLTKAYPEAKCSLDHGEPLELLIATILSAQCTDERVNKTTPALFKRFKTARDFATVPQRELEQYIKSCGFYKNKAANIIGACRKIVEKHGGEVPRTLEQLVELPGVGRKTANVVLGTSFGVPGVVVDTHCGRLARRMGFTKHDDPGKVEHDLMKVWPEETWSLFSHLFVYHGRAACVARGPRCSQCPVREWCPFPDSREGKKVAK